MNNIIDEKILDSCQRAVVLDESKNLLVIAGAGSGKTFTIVAKIQYLINNKKINPKDILCISFTNDATNSLKEKLSNDNIDVMTFHKLGLNILRDNKINFELCSNDYLDYIIHEFFFGIVFESSFYMRFILRYFNKFSFFNVENRYLKFISNNYNLINSLEKIISKFIKLYKTNGFEVIDFIKYIKKIHFMRDKLLLLLIFNIYTIYINELKSSNKIDFDDILIESSNIIKNGGSIKKYKYIIIDEYQDTSYIRYNLIKNIIDVIDSNFIAVGDDFQSIYKFSGCNLNIFTNFDSFFYNPTVVKLQNTYRNSQELINIAGSFVMKNKGQIYKELKSNKHLINPVKIYYKENLKELIDLINGNIMILGRNNDDIFSYLDDELYFENGNLVYTKNNCIRIKYYTVHSSKGLEEDNVIIINVIDDILGFPNKIEDDSIFRYLYYDKYSKEEERRLFYVALTRAKNYVYIMTQHGKESVFIKELLRLKEIEVIK